MGEGVCTPRLTCTAAGRVLQRAAYMCCRWPYCTPTFQIGARLCMGSPKQQQERCHKGCCKPAGQPSMKLHGSCCSTQLLQLAATVQDAL